MMKLTSSVNKMPPAKDDQIDYERRAQRMIARWAGVRGPVRSDEERNNVTEIFTDRLQLSESREESFVLGTLKKPLKINFRIGTIFRESKEGPNFDSMSSPGGGWRTKWIECSNQRCSSRCRCGFMRKIRMFWRCDYYSWNGNYCLVSL